MSTGANTVSKCGKTGIGSKHGRKYGQQARGAKAGSRQRAGGRQAKYRRGGRFTAERVHRDFLAKVLSARVHFDALAEVLRPSAWISAATAMAGSGAACTSNIKGA